jgi:hypothetical protein
MHATQIGLDPLPPSSLNGTGSDGCVSIRYSELNRPNSTQRVAIPMWILPDSTVGFVKCSVSLIIVRYKSQKGTVCTVDRTL